jgi:LacI family transcriptional regulator
LLLNLARSRSIKVPEQLAIIGYDNSPIAALPLIGLTSIDQSGKKLGKLAAEALLSRIGGRTAAHHILVEPTLVSRSST